MNMDFTNAVSVHRLLRQTDRFQGKLPLLKKSDKYKSFGACSEAMNLIAN